MFEIDQDPELMRHALNSHLRLAFELDGEQIPTRLDQLMRQLREREIAANDEAAPKSGLRTGAT
ncbi:MAG: hypothetical protein ACPGNV_04275 [Mangrovicoccus sp.]